MTILSAYREFKDARGQICGVVNDGHWEEINYVTSAAGCMRGGHFHRSTRELFLLISGTVRVRIKAADRLNTEEYTFSDGSIFVVEPGEAHWFETLTPCSWINVLSKRIDQSAPDIVPVAA